MEKDTVIINSDIELTDENGNKIDVMTLPPETLELWA